MSAVSNINSILRFAVAVLVAFAASCTTEPAIDDPDVSTAKVTLRLSTCSSVTRDYEHNDDGSNDPYGEQGETRQEEKINRVDLFFFSSGQSDETSFFTYEATNLNDITTSDLSVRIPIELTEHFTDDNAYVYALVNLPSEITVSESANTIGGLPATLENLTTVWVQASGFVSKDIPSSFVMRGGSEVTISGTGKSAEVYGVITVERLAAKIRLWADIPQALYFDADGKALYQNENESLAEWNVRRETEAVETWESVTTDENTGESNVRLYLYNLTTRGRIDAFLGSENDRPDLGYENIDRRDEVQDAVRRLSKGVKLSEPADPRYAQYTYTHAAPYYSYPNEWDSTTPAEEHQTYLIIEVPWRRHDNETGEIYQRCYYQVPVNALKMNNAEADRLDPNRYYRIRIRLGVLGSKDLGSPTKVDASWEVVDWVTENVDVNIKNRRYLVVNQKVWTMNNISTLQIPFSTSHKAEIVYCYVNYFRYNDIWGTAENTNNVHNMGEFDDWMTAADKQLEGGHQNGEGLIETSYVTQTETTPIIDGPKTEWVWKAWVDWWPWLRRLIRVTKTNITNNIEQTSVTEQLYYKKDYFYDPVYGFKYYLGHEHPITFQPDFVEYTDEQLESLDMTADEKTAWELYKSRYGMNAIYTCTIDNDNGVINFSHPLVQWKPVRKREDTGREDKIDYGSEEDVDPWGNTTTTTTTAIVKHYSGTLQYYVPELHPRLNGSLWDEFSRCEIVIKIRHEDHEAQDGLYEETIHITQYPAMYVEVSHDYGDIYKSSSPVANRGNQYVIVNGETTEDPGRDNYGTATEWWETTSWVRMYGDINNNPNMYVIHTSQLSEENEILYDLGDPRTLHFNNDLSDESFTGKTNVENSDIENKDNKWPSIRLKVNDLWRVVEYDNYDISIASAPRLLESNQSGKLKYYYPTSELSGAGSKENFIAPSFRIASSFGKVSLMYDANANGDNKQNSMPKLQGVSRAEARRRCASYQEAGRPAGRWRVPTMAEIKYLVQLSADGKIPHLFGLPSMPEIYAPYLSANGLVGVRLSDSDVAPVNEEDLETSPAVRCIYDEWYWTKIDGKNLPTTKGALETTFYWGDQKKDNTQAQSAIQTLINPKAVVANE